MRPSRELVKILLVIGCCSSFGLVASYAGVAWLSERYTNQTFEAMNKDWDETFSKFQTRIDSDFNLLSENPVFIDFARIKNAEPLVRAHFTWDGDKSGSAPEGEAFEQETKLKEFKARYAAKLDEKEWNKILSDPNLSALKLSWIDDLISYDHFNLATHPSHQQALKLIESKNGLERVAITSTLPIPNYGLLQAAALYRFAQLYKAGKLEDAARLHRHLAYLSFTSNTLIGGMVSVAMLNRERKLAEILKTYPIDVIDEARTRALKAAPWVWMGVLQTNFTSDRFSKLATQFNRDTGACVAASEMFTQMALASYFERAAFLEQDFRADFKRVRLVEEKILRVCGLEAYAPMLTPIRDETEPMWLTKDQAVASGYVTRAVPIPNPARIPFVRRFVGATLLSVARPNPFSVYEKEAREPASK